MLSYWAVKKPSPTEPVQWFPPRLFLCLQFSPPHCFYTNQACDSPLAALALAAVLCLLLLLSGGNCASRSPHVSTSPSSFEERLTSTTLREHFDVSPWRGETLYASFELRSSLSPVAWETIAGVTPAVTSGEATTRLSASKEAAPRRGRLWWKGGFSSVKARVVAAAAACLLVLLLLAGRVRQYQGKAAEAEHPAARAAAEICADLVALAGGAEELSKLLVPEEAHEPTSRLNVIVVAARKEEHLLQRQQQEQQAPRLKRLQELHEEAVQVVRELCEQARFCLVAAAADGGAKRRCTQKAQKQLEALYNEASACLREHGSRNPLQVHALAAQLISKATAAELVSLHALKNDFEWSLQQQPAAAAETAGAAAAEAGAAGPTETGAGGGDEGLVIAPRVLLAKALEALQAAATSRQRLSSLMRKAVAWSEEAEDAAVTAVRAGSFELLTKLSTMRMHMQVLQLHGETAKEPVASYAHREEQPFQAALAALDKDCRVLEQLNRKVHGRPDSFEALRLYEKAQGVFQSSLKKVAAALSMTEEGSPSARAAAVLSRLEQAVAAVVAQGSGAGTDEESATRYRELLLYMVSAVVTEAEFVEAGFISPSVKKELNNPVSTRFLLPYLQSYQLRAAWDAAASNCILMLKRIKAKHADLDEARDPNAALQAAHSLMALASNLTKEAATASSHASACRAWLKVEQILGAAFDEYAKAMQALETLLQEQQQQQQQEGVQQKQEQQKQEQLQRVLQQLQLPPERVLQRRARVALQEGNISDAAFLAADVATRARDIERYVRDRRNKQQELQQQQ
ncbi:hypothetical protein Esti_006394 [Eimeria stiedai]